MNLESESILWWAYFKLEREEYWAWKNRTHETGLYENYGLRIGSFLGSSFAAYQYVGFQGYGPAMT